MSGITKALADLADGESDVLADYGPEGLEAGYGDLIASVCLQHPKEVALELCRQKLGWVPQDVARFFKVTVAEQEDGFMV